MPLVLGERVLETSTTTGTSAFTLNGPTVGFQSFFDKVGNGNTCYYTIRNRTVPAEWETGIGTISGTSASGILTRTTILSSSTGSAVSFSAGTKDIFDTLPASKSVYTDTSKKLLIDTTTSLEVETTNLPISMPSLNLDFARSKQLDPRITFGRLSAATYYDGKTTAKAEENLCTGSQAIGGTAWGNQNCTGVTNTPNTTAPDGTQTASLLYPNAGVTFARSYSLTGVTTNSERHFYSVYAKASGINFISFSAPTTGGTGVCWFNLSTGTLGTDTTTTASITSIGNGWYRCSFSYIFNTGRLSIIICDADNSVAVTPNGTNGAYLWGAQLEQRSSATAYTPTTTTAITNYIPVLVSAPSNVPRFDHDSRPTFNATATVSGSTVTLPTTFADGSSPSSVNNYYKGSITVANVSYPIVSYKGSTRVLTVTGTPTTGSQTISLVNKNYGQSLGLLIEESRTNLFTYNNDFVNRVWSQNLITISAPTIIAPDGTLTGVKFIPTAVSTSHFTYANILSGIANNTTYTTSIYVKKGEYDTFTINLNNTYNTFPVSNITFNLTTGKIDSASGSLTATYAMIPVGNGWYRCSVTDTTTSAVTAGSMRTYFYVTTNVVYSGNGYDGLYVWGLQFEQGSFATSYVPTPSSSTVTRQPDLASMTGTNFSSWYNQSEGSMYAEYDTFGRATGYIFTISEGSGGVNYISLIKGNSGFTNRFTTVSTSVSQGNIDIGSIAINTNYKLIGSYITNNNNFCVNGGTVANDSTVTLPPNINNAYFGTYFTQSMNGHIRKLTYYPQALSSLELQGLTK